jgi:hypothetical protein
MPDRKREQLLQLVDILASDSFTHDELRTYTYFILGAGAYKHLEGKSKRDKALSLLEELESTDRIGELVNLIKERRPDIPLPDFEAETEPDSLERTDDADDQERTELASSSLLQRDQTVPKYSEELRRQRPGYDRVRKLVEEYDHLTADEIGRMSEADLTDTYLQPLFEALGWSVSKEVPLTAFRSEGWSSVVQIDLLLTYRDLRVLAEAQKPGERLGEQADNQLFLYLHRTRNSWGFLTNFEIIRVLDYRDVNHSTLLLETGPRLYVTDDSEKHDLLAAEVFYNRLVLSQPEEKSESSQQAEDMARARRIVADIEAMFPFDRTAAALSEETGVPGPEGLTSLLQEALEDTRELENEDARSEALVGLAPYLSKPLLQEALAMAREIEDDGARAQVLVRLAQFLPADQRDEVQTEIQAAETAAVEGITAERRERIEIAVRALADSPSKVDLLGFLDYAKALADFIRSEKTEKPLTIGIDAAWGMGKTTLMGMIEKQLTEPQGGERRGSFFTVRFNAWKYDQEESLWAALALQILAEVKKQFNWRERLQLWLKLNYQRVDRALLWRSVIKLFVSATGIYLLGAVVFGIIALWLGTDLLAKYAASVGILGFIAAMYAAGREIFDRLAGPFDLNLGEYVRKPDYKERIGFLAEFEEDFQHVVKAVTRDGRCPLVVFIDDLDRCAPPKPAEIIEAINILLGAQHCVFVLGMDAQAVACSIEAKYKDLCERLGDAEDPGGLTLGQRFLEKIVQINFRIPRADTRLIESFVDAHLGSLSEEPSEKPREEEVRVEAERLIEAEQRAGKPLDEAVEVVKVARPDMSQEIVTEARQEVFARSFDDSEDVKHAVYEAVPYLECNPRKIKRFINVFRLRALIANRRGLLEGGVIRLELLAKWMIVGMRWPDFARVASDDESWIASLVEAYDIQGKLIGPSALRVDDQQRKDAQSRLDLLLADPRVKRWVDADDLVELLKGTTTQTGWNLSNYAQLAQTVSEGSYTTGGTGLS